MANLYLLYENESSRSKKADEFVQVGSPAVPGIQVFRFLRRLGSKILGPCGAWVSE